MSTKEKIYTIINSLSEEECGEVLDYIISNFHLPNAETIKAIKDVENGKNLEGPFDNVEEMMKTLLL